MKCLYVPGSDRPGAPLAMLAQLHALAVATARRAAGAIAGASWQQLRAFAIALYSPFEAQIARCSAVSSLFPCVHTQVCCFGHANSCAACSAPLHSLLQVQRTMCSNWFKFRVRAHLNLISARNVLIAAAAQNSQVPSRHVWLTSVALDFVRRCPVDDGILNFLGKSETSCCKVIAIMQQGFSGRL